MLGLPDGGGYSGGVSEKRGPWARLCVPGGGGRTLFRFGGYGG